MAKRDEPTQPGGGEPKPKKRRKRRKRRPDSGGKTTRRRATDGPATKAGRDGEQDPDAGARKHEEGEDGRRWPSVWLVLLVTGLLEVWLFGRRGHIEVCVARDGEHDFALLGTPRNDSNTKRYPTCEKRLNIGLSSHYDDAYEDALVRACQRATVLRGMEMTKACALGLAGWRQRTEVSWCPPWHDHYTKRLFWFLE